MRAEFVRAVPASDCPRVGFVTVASGVVGGVDGRASRAKQTPDVAGSVGWRTRDTRRRVSMPWVARRVDLRLGGFDREELTHAAELLVPFRQELFGRNAGEFPKAL